MLPKRGSRIAAAPKFGLSFNYNCGPAATSALPASLLSYLAKFLMNLCARSFALTSHSEAFAYVLRGSRIFVSTPGRAVGTSKLKYGIVFVSAFRISPLRIASMIPRVSLMEIRFPVPVSYTHLSAKSQGAD